MGSNDNFLITFPSQIGQAYRVEWTEGLSPPSWSAVTDNVPGTGSAIVTPDTGVSLRPERFYRVLILSP